jgi:hypothetical protein
LVLGLHPLTAERASLRFPRRAMLKDNSHTVGFCTDSDRFCWT